MLWIEIDRSSEKTLFRQIYEQLVTRILKGELEPKTRLPGSRNLAEDLQVSRNVVTSVYDQMIAEGYLVTRQGAGTFVAEGVIYRDYNSHSELDKRPDTVPTSGNQIIPINFACGIPESDSFPKKHWLSSIQKEMWWSDLSIASYTDVRGLKSLRKNLARYLIKSKYITCSLDQIFIVSGTSQTLDLLSKFFKSRFSSIYTEDPVVDFVPAIFRANSYDIVSIPVDSNGLQVEKLNLPETGSLVFVSPSHQFPTGSSMPIQRRIELIELAKKTNSIIIEDDYDSEFRYDGTPIQSLQMLDAERVFHLGTFSKILGAGLRLSYMVVPKQFSKEIYELKNNLHISTPTLEQEVLGAFIRKGHLERHVLKMKKKYRKKMLHLSNALERSFASDIEIKGNSTGMHLMVQFKNHTFEQTTKKGILDAGLVVDYFENYSITLPSDSNTLVLGFGNLSLEEISEGVNRLAKVLEVKH